ncbi:MAG TPA: Zn-dependent hydrolase [Bacteroidales bacterium]|nr:Zn-dependent hydrolase [Bacteroidales bacterium]
MIKKQIILSALFLAVLFTACKNQPSKNQQPNEEMKKLVEMYTPFELSSDLSHLTENEKEMVKIFFEAASIIDKIYWIEAYGSKEELLSGLDENTKIFAEINYGPWNRLADNAPFIAGVGVKPAGANFYPSDITSEEFEAWDDVNKDNLYTLIRRDENGKLKSFWYHEFFEEDIEKVAMLLRKAAALSEDDGMKNYLNLRAEALLTDEYFASDMAWLDMKDSKMDLVIGPIENYEDALFGYKAAHEAFILIKDIAWSQKLAHFAQFLPELQKQIPAEEKYKKETPGFDTDLNAYDVIYYAGDCNAGSKTIAINLPNDERVQMEKGTRRLQLKNSMRAKFEKILVPISNVLISEEQRKFVTFDAFFANTMFHEVAHGLGIKNTINGKGPVRKALKEQYSALEEGKADILGLFMVSKLNEMGEFADTDLMENYVTFMAGIFRSVRFGAASAHGKANMVRFNYFLEKQAFAKQADGTYAIDFEKMKAASRDLTALILMIQGEGDYEAAKNLVETKGIITADLQADLNKVDAAGIPTDIVFEQGPKYVGL